MARFDPKTLAFEEKVAVDANPEQIVELNDTLYCINSGYGKGNTLSAISVRTFKTSKSYTTFSNPYGLQKANGRLYVSAYDQYYNSHVGVYDVKTNQTHEIGYATKVLASGDRLYMMNATSPDWVTYNTTFNVYDAVHDTVLDWNLKGAPGAMLTGAAVPYFMKVNPVDGNLYVGYTDYFSNATVYVFSSNDEYKESFSVPGINANNIVFLVK